MALMDAMPEIVHGGYIQSSEERSKALPTLS